MPQMDWLGWIFVGWIAGWLSGAVVKRGGPRGCFGDTVIGVVGGLLGGWFATTQLHSGPTEGFLAALLVAFVGAAVLRLLLDAVSGDRRPGDRRW